MSRALIFAEIEKEREYQDRRWGTAFDNANTINDWAAYFAAYTARATSMGNTKEQQRAALVKVAAIAVASLETFDRNNGFPGRHYDPPVNVAAVV